ncbi:MAG TPA: ABC transporter permease [Chloroflexota bacterium]|nr:ABC transporter permease [Chloroflexota bacterium]
MKRLFRIYDDIPRGVYLGVAIFSICFILALWSLLSYTGLTDTRLLPTPSDVLAAAQREAGDGTLWGDMLASSYRIGLGFLASTVLAIPIGLLMGTLKIGEAFFEPPIDLIRYMPAVAFVPLTIVWIGTDDRQKVAILFIGTFFQQVLLIMDNVKNVPRNLVNVAYTFGLKPWEVLTRVILPASLPGIVDTLRITMGWAWTYLVVCELVAADQGLGSRIMISERYFDMPAMILGVLVIGLLGITIDYLFKFLYARLFPYMKRRAA